MVSLIHPPPQAAMVGFPSQRTQAPASRYTPSHRHSFGMEVDYRILRALVPAARSSRGFVIGSRHQSAATQALDRLQLPSSPTTTSDRHLLEASRHLNDPEALLCLRCHVSQAIEQKLLALMRRFGRSHQLDLIDMAATVLDDPGHPLGWDSADATSEPSHRPFALEVLGSFQPELAGLGHWTRVRVQSHPELARLLRNQGLLLISDWALLAHATPTRVERAWRLHGLAPLTDANVRRLHADFGELYRQRPGQAQGRWHPDAAFLLALAPDRPAATTLDQLQAIASALRRERLGMVPAHSEPCDAPPDVDNTSELLAQVEDSLRHHLRAQLPAMLNANSPDAALLACLWRRYGEGKKQREIAAHCDCSQAMVTRRLHLRGHATLIASATARTLRHHPGFESVDTSVEACERMVEALRAHLLEAGPDDPRPRLGRWLLDLLPQVKP